MLLASKSTKTLINGILEEKKQLTKDDNLNVQQQKSALIIIEQNVHKCGVLYCHNYQMEGHNPFECHGVERSRGH
jgi:hypothetical protein